MFNFKSYKAKLKSYYRDRFGYRDNFNLVGWMSRGSQELRFDVFIENVNPSGKKLLDAGSGAGDLFGYLQQKEIECDYTGVDILPQMVRRALKSYPEGNFLLSDLLKTSEFEKKSFDIVFCSGAMNLNLKDGGRFIKEFILKMTEFARESVCFNLLSDQSCDKDEDCFYYFNSLRFLHFLESFLPKDIQIKIVEGYLRNDFTVILKLPQ